MIPHSLAMELWQKAKEAKVGLAVKTNNRKALTNQLYEVRKQSGDERLRSISIMFPPNEEEIWLCNHPEERAFDEQDLDKL